ncbi:MAG: DUF1330 domain-containing protein [Pseudomonadota bacterium]
MHINPTRTQLESLKRLDREAPLSMLNLVRLRAKAEYQDGREATGAEAYTTYGRESGKFFQSVGGELIWRGMPQTVLIGPEAEHWHVAFIARYPTAAAFLAMITDPGYQAIVFHRDAGVEDSRLIAMGEQDAGGGFG